MDGLKVAGCDCRWENKMLDGIAEMATTQITVHKVFIPLVLEEDEQWMMAFIIPWIYRGRC